MPWQTFLAKWAHAFLVAWGFAFLAALIAGPIVRRLVARIIEAPGGKS
jgi:hypothetical protein